MKQFIVLMAMIVLGLALFGYIAVGDHSIKGASEKIFQQEYTFLNERFLEEENK